jgi:hypothetical protein
MSILNTVMFTVGVVTTIFKIVGQFSSSIAVPGMICALYVGGKKTFYIFCLGVVLSAFAYKLIFSVAQEDLKNNFTNPMLGLRPNAFHATQGTQPPIKFNALFTIKNKKRKFCKR